MLYWLNNKTEKNNIVILSKVAVLLGSCGALSCEKVEAQLQKNANPAAVLGKENIVLIPFQRIQKINSEVTAPVITLSIQMAKGIANKTLGFSDFEARDKCFLYLKQLKVNSQGTAKNTAKPVASVATKSKVASSPSPVSTSRSSHPESLMSKPVQELSKKEPAFGRKPEVKRQVSESNSPKKNWLNKKTGMIAAGLVVTLLGGYFAYSLMPKADALYAAIQAENIVSADIEAYLENGADINYQGMDGVTPLLSAINHNKEDLVVTLVNKGADLDDDYNGDTALDIAIASGLNNAVGSMLDKKAPSRNKNDLLTRAIQNKLSLNNLDKIVLSGCDINYVNDNGSSVLATALLFGAGNNVIQLLLEKGASTSIRVNGLTPAEFAQSRGNMQLASLLTQY